MAVASAASWLKCLPSAGSRPAGFRLMAIAGLCIALGACQSDKVETASSDSRAQSVRDVPITQGRYVVGKPYRKNGVLYRPAEDWSYNEVGIASWYGLEHHGQRTANGETFDLRAMTAAHPTLPLPSRVRVTNIENGKSIVVRVNDRGPFKDNRLIDLSRRAAEALGFRKEGTARVRVEMLGRAPLEMFRMAKPDAGPDLPVRAAPSADVKAAVLPPPSAAQEETRREEKPESQGGGDAEEEDVSSAIEAPEDPLENLINRMEAENEEDGESAGEPGENAEQTAAAYAAGDVSAAPSGDQRYFIQAGAFTVPENAYSLRRLILKAIDGAAVSINPAQVDHRQFFRVRVGPFSTTEEAEGMLAQLRNMGQNEAKIIRN